MKKNINIAFKLFSVFTLGFISIFPANAAIHPASSCDSVYNSGASDCQSGGDTDSFYYSGSCQSGSSVISPTVSSCNSQIKYYNPATNAYSTGTSVPGGSFQSATYGWSACSCNSTCDMTSATTIETDVAVTCAVGEIPVFNTGSCEYSCQAVTATYLTKYVGDTTTNIEASVVFQDNDGEIGIGETAPTEKLEVDGNVLADEYLYTSDIRLKENISPIKNALHKVLNLAGVYFDWKKTGKTNIGFIAQEVEKVVPEIVTGEDENMKSVSYGNITALLVEAIKEQQKQIEELKAQIAELSK